MKINNRASNYIMCFMISSPPRSTITDTLCPSTTLFRSHACTAVAEGKTWGRERVRKGRNPGTQRPATGTFGAAADVAGFAYGDGHEAIAPRRRRVAARRVVRLRHHPAAQPVGAVACLAPFRAAAGPGDRAAPHRAAPSAAGIPRAPAPEPPPPAPSPPPAP